MNPTRVTWRQTRRAPTGPKGPDAASICDDRLVPEVASRWLLGSLAGKERVQARRERSSGALTLQAGGDASVAVQHDGDGDGRHLEPLGDGSGRVEQHGKVMCDVRANARARGLVSWVATARNRMPLAW